MFLGFLFIITFSPQHCRRLIPKAIQERDERLDFTALAGMGQGLSGAEAEEFETLKVKDRKGWFGSVVRSFCPTRVGGAWFKPLHLCRRMPHTNVTVTCTS